MVSVIIPAYNAERFIENTVKSVLSQSYTNFELIIIDDGSTDKTQSLIQNFSDKRIKYIYQQNGGVSSARNNGLANASGDYIALLDADDIWEPDNLELKIQFLKGNKDYDWAYSDMNTFTKDDLSDRELIKGHDSNLLDNYLAQKNFGVPGICSNVVFKRAAALKSNIVFDTHLSTAADQDFLIMLARFHKGGYIGKALWNYRLSSSSMSKNIMALENDHLYILKKMARLKVYKSSIFKLNCISNHRLIIAACWWVNGNKKVRALKHLSVALFVYPPNSIKLIKKICAG